MWSTGEGHGKPLQYSCLENPMNSMKRQNDRILKEKLPRSVTVNVIYHINRIKDKTYDYLNRCIKNLTKSNI